MAINSTPNDTSHWHWTAPQLQGENHAMDAQEPQQITGLILAGGLGSRMGGIDKGLQQLKGKPLVAHVIDRLKPQVDTLLVSANRNIDTYAAFGYPVVTDRIDGFAGPLAGLHAGLTACTTALLVCVPCDSPFLPTDLVSCLRKALSGQNADIALPMTRDGLQPVFAVMRREVLPSLSDYLAAGRHRMQDWCKQLRLTVLQFPDEQAFANANSREDLDVLGRSG
jgi:molybdopterin-guanine dinucleotide biosynthesis protein A